MIYKPVTRDSDNHARTYTHTQRHTHTYRAQHFPQNELCFYVTPACQFAVCVCESSQRRWDVRRFCFHGPFFSLSLFFLPPFIPLLSVCLCFCLCFCLCHSLFSLSLSVFLYLSLFLSVCLSRRMSSRTRSLSPAS